MYFQHPWLLRTVLVGLVLTIDMSRGTQTSGMQPSKIHTYFIAAEEVDWNYVPRGRNLTGTPRTESGEDEASGREAGRWVYHKAIFREYTNATFKRPKPRPPQWEHLGILGPLLRAEVGDTIRVVFRNNTKIACSMHPHGLAYDKDSEGASYNDRTPAEAKKDDVVLPGQTYTYTWLVPERAGPGPGDPSSILWMYHSHVVEAQDINTGLIGPIIVSGRGSTQANGRPKDVDREFVTAFVVFDETESLFFQARIAKFHQPVRLSDPLFRAANTFYSINGLVEGNLPMLAMKRGERVRWYLFAGSNEDDVHTVHWHGQTVLFQHMRSDTVHLEPMGMAVADMVPDTAGVWLYHCHVNDHLAGGMDALFTVAP